MRGGEGGYWQSFSVQLLPCSVGFFLLGCLFPPPPPPHPPHTHLIFASGRSLFSRDVRTHGPNYILNSDVHGTLDNISYAFLALNFVSNLFYDFLYVGGVYIWIVCAFVNVCVVFFFQFNQSVLFTWKVSKFDGSVLLLCTAALLLSLPSPKLFLHPLRRCVVFGKDCDTFHSSASIAVKMFVLCCCWKKVVFLLLDFSDELSSGFVVVFHFLFFINRVQLFVCFIRACVNQDCAPGTNQPSQGQTACLVHWMFFYFYVM